MLLTSPHPLHTTYLLADAATALPRAPLLLAYPAALVGPLCAAPMALGLHPAWPRAYLQRARQVVAAAAAAALNLHGHFIGA